MVAISSFILVLPPTVATDKEACPPAFTILWKTSNKRVNSSPIFASESEVEKKVHWSTETMLLHFQYFKYQYNIKLWKLKDNLRQIHHMHPHISLTSERSLVFYLYLQKFKMDFSLPAVIFATANFHKRKFFLRHPVQSPKIVWTGTP